MCYDRGYALSPEECNLTLTEFKSKATDSNGQISRAMMAYKADPTHAMSQRYTALPRPGQTEPPLPQIGSIYVSFNGATNVGIKEIKTFAQDLDQNNHYTGLFVTSAAPTSSALKIIPSLLPIIMEIFREEDLLVNISQHELVPKHILLSPEEKRSLLERYRLKETQLPRIRVDDPMARFLGLRRGQVVKIIRKSETAGRYASYRWAI